MTPLEIVWMLLAFVGGIAFIPLVIYLFGPSFPLGVKRIIGKAMFTMMMLSFGAAVLRKRATGGYEFWAAEHDEDEEKLVAERDETTVEVDGPVRYLKRLGKKPLGFSAEKTKDVLSKYQSDLSDYRSAATADGGEYVKIESDRQGHPIVLETDLLAGRDFVADARKIWPQVQTAAGSSLVERGEQQALKEDGGKNEIGTTMTMVLTLVATLCGAGISYMTLVGV